jgi:uncharacterized protein YgbK (DUF1537 family)
MKPLYAFYGDDFTGSTDVLEQLAEGGVPAVLFLRTPDEALQTRFSEARAIGIAGESRSRSPEWMDAHLPAAFAALAEADVVHYKTCSTFDSSPTIGSIGRALDIGSRMFGGVVPILVAAPYLGRYVLFGNLFAAAGDEVYRIDRHPTMSRHPVTPMHEADLRRHLAAQSDASIALVPIDRIQAGEAQAAFDAFECGAVLFDGLDTASVAAAGAVLLSSGAKFAVGSSGVTAALVAAWQSVGRVSPPLSLDRAEEVDRLLVVSGSCSPVTARQVERSATAGYTTIRVDVGALLGGDTAEERRVVEMAGAGLESGGRCIVHSADGPLEQTASAAGEKLGQALGRIARQVIQRQRPRRIVFAGGDSSTHAVAELGIEALTWAAPLERGAPLVRAHSENPDVDGLELVLKGGQIGGDDFFEIARRGGQGVVRRAQSPQPNGISGQRVSAAAREG